MVLVSEGNFKGCCAGRTCRALCMAAKAAWYQHNTVRKIYICVDTDTVCVAEEGGFFIFHNSAASRVVELRVL